jgi:hypothetical protein
VILSVESDATREAVGALEGDALVEHIGGRAGATCGPAPS